MEETIREIIIFTIINGSNEYDAAISAMFFFVFIIVVVFGGMIVATVVYSCLKMYDKNIYIRIVPFLVYTFASVLYYYGDNIVGLLRVFGPQLGCDSSCMMFNRAAAVICSGSAVLIFKRYPGFQVQINDLVGFVGGIKMFFSAAEMITLYIILDALYNAVVAATSEVGQLCTFGDLSVDIIFIVILVVSGIIIVTVNLFYAVKRVGNKKNFSIYVTYFAVVISLPLYMLANNSQPLDCAFGCHAFTGNATLDTPSCDEVGVTVFRMVISFILFVGVIALSCLLFFKKEKSKIKKTAA